MEVRQALRECATASPSRTILVAGRAITAAVIATKSALQFRPFRLHSRISSAVLQRDDPKAVVLDLVNPAAADRHLPRAPAGRVG